MLLLQLQLLLLSHALGNAATATKATTAGSCTGNANTATTANSAKTCTGNSATASKLARARNIKIQGAVSGNANFDGSANITINTTVGVSKVEKTVSNNGITIKMTLKKQLNMVYASFNFTIPKDTLTPFSVTSFLPTGYIPSETIGIYFMEDSSGDQTVKAYLRSNGVIQGVAKNNNTTGSVIISTQVAYLVN